MHEQCAPETVPCLLLNATHGTCGVALTGVRAVELNTIWNCMGTVWALMEPYGTVWALMKPYGHLWDRVGSYGTVWAPYGLLLNRMGTYETVWVRVPIRSYTVPYGV